MARSPCAPIYISLISIGSLHFTRGGGYISLISIGSLSLRTNRRVHTHIHTYAYIYMYIFLCLSLSCVCECVCVPTYTYTHTYHIHTHVHIDIRLSHHMVKPQVEFVEGKHFVALICGLAGIILVSVGVVKLDAGENRIVVALETSHRFPKTSFRGKFI